MTDDRLLPVDSALYEALYRLEAPTGALAEKLRALGLDPGHPGRTNSETFKATLQLYHAHLFPLELDAEGARKLGRALAEAFGKTLPGKLLVISLPMLAPLQLLRRWPRFIRMGRLDVTIDVTELEGSAAIITSFDPVGVPMHVNLGLLEFAFEKMGHPLTTEYERLPDGYERVTVRW